MISPLFFRSTQNKLNINWGRLPSLPNQILISSKLFSPTLIFSYIKLCRRPLPKKQSHWMAGDKSTHLFALWLVSFNVRLSGVHVCTFAQPARGSVVTVSSHKKPLLSLEETRAPARTLHRSCRRFLWLKWRGKTLRLYSKTSSSQLHKVLWAPEAKHTVNTEYWSWN